MTAAAGPQIRRRASEYLAADIAISHSAIGGYIAIHAVGGK